MIEKKSNLRRGKSPDEKKSRLVFIDHVKQVGFKASFKCDEWWVGVRLCLEG